MISEYRAPSCSDAEDGEFAERIHEGEQSLLGASPDQRGRVAAGSSAPLADFSPETTAPPLSIQNSSGVTRDHGGRFPIPWRQLAAT
jgi:hypothetical protein